MRLVLLCSLLLACVPEDKSTSTSDSTSTSTSTSEVTTGPASTSGSTGSTGSTGTGTTSSPAACEGLDEPACLADPACMAHYGAPRIPQNGMLCTDSKHPQFLACGVSGPPCPPVVLTVCPIGQPDVAFDVASGCVPPGYETCMDGPAAECP